MIPMTQAIAAPEGAAEDQAGVTNASVRDLPVLEVNQPQDIAARSRLYQATDRDNRFVGAWVPRRVFAIQRPRAGASKRSHSQVLQQWEGVVTSIRDGEITCRLRDLIQRDSPEERATISLDEVADADRPLVEIGAVFYWSIGYQIEPHGTKRLASTVRFRRLPVWTQRDLQRVEQEAREFDFLLDGE